MNSHSFDLNPRVASVQPSATLAMTARSKELKRAGRPVISLSAGEPDFDTPAPVAEAGIRAIREGFTRYTENTGMLELREKICAKLQRDNGLDYSPEQIVCSNGAKQVVAMAVEALCRPGDEVLIPAPYWVSYPEMVRLAGGTPVFLPTTVETGYRITTDQLERAITPKTRLLMLCSPSNPTGAVYDREQLAALARVLERHEDLFVLSDEIYEYIVFDAEHVSFACFPGMKERTITINGFSKAYAMTGWRLGYLAAVPTIARAVARIQSQVTSAPSTIAQKAGIAALDLDRSVIDEMVRAFRSRRDFLLDRLSRIDGIRCPRPDGAFYLFPDVSAYFGRKTPAGRPIDHSEDLCMYLLEEHDLGLVQGSAFGGPDGLRISYAASLQDLEIAMNRFENGLAALE